MFYVFVLLLDYICNLDNYSNNTNPQYKKDFQVEKLTIEDKNYFIDDNYNDIVETNEFLVEKSNQSTEYQPEYCLKYIKDYLLHN